jgi:hypothetical protein
MHEGDVGRGARRLSSPYGLRKRHTHHVHWIDSKTNADNFVRQAASFHLLPRVSLDPWSRVADVASVVRLGRSWRTLSSPAGQQLITSPRALRMQSASLNVSV